MMWCVVRLISRMTEDLRQMGQGLYNVSFKGNCKQYTRHLQAGLTRSGCHSVNCCEQLRVLALTSKGIKAVHN